MNKKGKLIAQADNNILQNAAQSLPQAIYKFHFLLLLKSPNTSANQDRIKEAEFSSPMQDSENLRKALEGLSINNQYFNCQLCAFP